MHYHEPLPPDCPPEDAVEISEPITMYRLVKTLPPTVEDFRSYRSLRPTDDFSNNLCKASGLSVYSTHASAERQLRRPVFARYHVCKLRLNTGAGKIQKTGGTHHTWWPYSGYLVSTDAGAVQL